MNSINGDPNGTDLVVAMVLIVMTVFLSVLGFCEFIDWLIHG